MSQPCARYLRTPSPPHRLCDRESWTRHRPWIPFPWSCWVAGLWKISTAEVVAQLFDAILIKNSWSQQRTRRRIVTLPRWACRCPMGIPWNHLTYSSSHCRQLGRFFCRRCRVRPGWHHPAEKCRLHDEREEPDLQAHWRMVLARSSDQTYCSFDLQASRIYPRKLV